MIQAEDALGFVGKAKYLPSPTVESRLNTHPPLGSFELSRFWVCQLPAARRHVLRMTGFFLALKFSSNSLRLFTFSAECCRGRDGGAAGVGDMWQRG